MGVKLDPATLAACVLIACLYFLQSNTGVADNGDFDRSIGWLLEKPVGLSENIPSIGSPERIRRYFYAWHDRWSYRNSIELPTSFSSYQLLLLPGYLLNRLTGSPFYSLSLASIASRAILLIVILWLGTQVFAQTSIGWTLILAFIFADSRYISFLNSFYQEHAAIIFLLMLIASIAAFERKQSKWSMLFLGSSLLLFSYAKLQYVFTPVLLLFIFLLLRPVTRYRKTVLLVIFGIQLATIPLLATNRYSIHNNFNALFTGALYFDQQYFPDWLDPELKKCVGVSVWSHVPGCLEKFDSNMGKREILAVYSENPISFWRGVDFGIRHLNRIDLGSAYSLASGSPHSFHDFFLFNIWRHGKQLLSGGLVYLELAIIGMILLFAAKSNGLHFRLILFLLAFVMSQIIISLLGEGTVDMNKHLLLANAALDLALLIAAYILSISLLKSRRWRGEEIPASPLSGRMAPVQPFPNDQWQP